MVSSAPAIALMTVGTMTGFERVTRDRNPVAPADQSKPRMRCASTVVWKSAASDGRKRKVRSIPKANFSGMPSRWKATPKSDGAMAKAIGKPMVAIVR